MALLPTQVWGRDFQQMHLRKGKWTLEEENYANKIIDLFNQGCLPIMAGTTLRSYLSDKLRCDPMRITKKYAGTSCIGKQIYQPCSQYLGSSESFRESELELQKMEQLFLMRISSKGLYPDDEGNGSSSSSFEPLRRNTPRNCSKTDLAGSFSSELPSAGRWKGKRIHSAPDLTELDSLVKLAGQAIKSDPDERQSPMTVSQSSGANSMGSRLWSAGLKRSHSVMALMDFEKLVADDHAAGELFLEFVSQMGNKRQALQSSAPATSGNAPWMMTSSIGQQVAQSIIASNVDDQSQSNSTEAAESKISESDEHEVSAPPVQPQPSPPVADDREEVADAAVVIDAADLASAGPDRAEEGDNFF